MDIKHINVVRMVICFFFLMIFCSCVKDTKMSMVDCRLISDEFADSVLIKYLNNETLQNREYFILNVYRVRDSLTFVIRPITQKSDSMSCLPIGYCEYKEKTVFIVLEDVCGFIRDLHSGTLLLFKKVIGKMPDYETKYKMYPHWMVKVSNQQFRIDSAYRFPQFLVHGPRYIPPRIPVDQE